MKPLQQASAQTAARAAESRTGSIETGGQRFTTYLTGERVAVPAKASGSTAAKVPAEGKRLRTDLGRKSGFFIKSQKTASRRDSLARIY